jgi:ComF family protein
VSIFQDFISLIYPRICYACGKSLYKYEKCLCTYCNYHLPKTNFHLDQDNPVSKLFWGKVNIFSAAAFYYYNKGTKVQHLIHQLKYKGHKEIGVYIGTIYGKELKKSVLFETVDVVIPVPLHPKKKIKRGFNQSEVFAAGLAEGMNILMDVKTLQRTYASETQTRKSRFARWENVKEIFALKDPETLENKHILLVDDVITTGSTIEACAQMLSAIPGIKISIAAIACTIH